MSSGRSCKWIKSYSGASKSATRTTEIVMMTVLPAWVLVSLQIRIAGLQNGKGSNNKIAMRPSNPPKTSKGRVKPNIAADALQTIRDFFQLHKRSSQRLRLNKVSPRPRSWRRRVDALRGFQICKGMHRFPATVVLYSSSQLLRAYKPFQHVLRKQKKRVPGCCFGDLPVLCSLCHSCVQYCVHG